MPQNNPPYNMGAFRFELTFSPHHPLEPPRARLLTSIYHPGVSKDGHVCQPLTSLHCWQHTTRAVHGGCRGLGGAGVRRIRALTPPLTPRVPPAVLQDLLLLLDHPDGERVMRLELARELGEQPETFWRRAEEHTRSHAEPRPQPPGS